MVRTGRLSRRRPRSTTASCAATSATSRPAASRGRRSPARPLRSAPTSVTSAAAASSSATWPPRSRRRRARAACPACRGARKPPRCSTISPSRPYPTTPKRSRDLAIVELLYGAGLRVSECCGLDVGDVDLRRATVTALGKGAKVRRLPLGEPACEAVAAYVTTGRTQLRQPHNPARRRLTPCSSMPGGGA